MGKRVIRDRGTEVVFVERMRPPPHVRSRKKANNCKTAFFNDSTVTEAFSLLAVLKVRQRGRAVTALDLQFGSPALGPVARSMVSVNQRLIP